MHATFIIIMMFISFYVLQEKLAKDKARMHHRQNSPERDLTLDLSQIRISKDRSKRRSGEISPDSKSLNSHRKGMMKSLVMVIIFVKT